jgi:DNA-binding response OmpR family regulator
VTEAAPSRPVALVVDDDEQIALMLKFIVEREGFDVIVAHDGRAAQEVMQSAPPPSLILLDVMLPYADGFQLIAEIRAHARWKNCPTVMLTAKAQEKDVARAMQAGANGYLVKPFLPDDLRATIRRVTAAAGGQ